MCIRSFNRLRLAILVLCGVCISASAAEITARGGLIDAVFGTPAECAERLVSEIQQAKRSVCLRTHALPTPSVLEAMREASAAGATCEITINASASEMTGITVPASVEVYRDPLYPVAIGSLQAIIDREVVVIGSMTTGVTLDKREVSQLQIIKSLPALTRQYDANYRQHRELATKVDVATKTQAPDSNPSHTPSVAGEVILGRSTPADVMKLWGEPVSVTVSPDGTKAWTYHEAVSDTVSQTELVTFTSDGKVWNHTTSRTMPKLMAAQETAASPKSPTSPAARPTPIEQTKVADTPAKDVVMVYVTKTGRKYHRADCQHARQNATAVTLQEALKKYTPCSRCDPSKKD